MSGTTSGKSGYGRGGGGGKRLIGYSSYNHLLFDLSSISVDHRNGMEIPKERLTFVLCPGRIIDLDDGTLPLGFIPVHVPGTTIQCGEYDGNNGGGGVEGACVIRGGGKRLGYIPSSTTSSSSSSSSSTPSTYGDRWNVNPNHSYKTNIEGILGGGEGSIAQIYVYGDTAYDVSLKGLTFDNAVSDDESRLYGEYVAAFGNTGGNDATDVMGKDGGPRPARRFASVAMRGMGYGDDAGPRLLSIEGCYFVNHRGYAILISPGIQLPNMPTAPEFLYLNHTETGVGEEDASEEDASEEDASETTMPLSLNPQSSGQHYGDHGNGTGVIVLGDEDNPNRRHRRTKTTGFPTRRRDLNLLDDGKMYIPPDGHVSYYGNGDSSGAYNYLDGRRVKISNTVFRDNESNEDGSVAGLVTSAYSITISGCLFERNTGKSMVFAYNDDAMVDDTVFVENTVEVSTIIMSSPREEDDATTSTTASLGDESIRPTHIVERTCFLGSSVGISNVLATSTDSVGFGQRDNHVVGTTFDWASTCDGAAAEEFGDDCLATGDCDGTCVGFTSPECLASRIKSGGHDQYSNAGGGLGGYFGGGGLGALLGVVLSFVWESTFWHL
jgi:hypothetical protein